MHSTLFFVVINKNQMRINTVRFSDQTLKEQTPYLASNLILVPRMLITMRHRRTWRSLEPPDTSQFLPEHQDIPWPRFNIGGLKVIHHLLKGNPFIHEMFPFYTLIVIHPTLAFSNRQWFINLPIPSFHQNEPLLPFSHTTLASPPQCPQGREANVQTSCQSAPQHQS